MTSSAAKLALAMTARVAQTWPPGRAREGATPLDSFEAAWYFRKRRVADEFPTLEVALAACVAWLAWRGWVLARSAARLVRDLASLSTAVQQGEASVPAASGNGPEAAWLGHLARAALSAVERGLTASELHQELQERARRIRRRLRSAAARDLVVCAVLIGALAYARSAHLGVSPAFFTLGAAAGALLLAAVGLRLWHGAQLVRTSELLSRAAAGRASKASAAQAAACASCGASGLIRARGAEELGQKLRDLGVTEVRVCPACGHLDGHVVRR